MDDGNSAAGDDDSDGKEADGVDEDEIFQEALRMVRARKAEEQRTVKRRQLNSGAPAEKAKQRGPTVSQMTTEVQLLTRTDLVFGVWSKYRPIKTSRTTCRKRQVHTGYSNIEQLFITSCLICTTVHTHPPSEEWE